MARSADVTTKGDKPFPWEALALRLVHPMQISILEAMLWIGLPLAASELRLAFDEAYGVSHVSFHMDRLVRLEALRKVGEVRLRGTLKPYYVVSGDALK